jgi:hypothetical protein
MSAQLTFAEAPFGLEPLTDFTLTHVEGGHGLFTLTADLDAGIRLSCWMPPRSSPTTRRF